MTRKAYPSDVSDDEWAFVTRYLTLMREDAPQREHSLREVFNGLRYVVHTGMQWRFMAHDLPPWHTVYQQTQRWLKAGVFEDIVRDLRMLIREINERMPQPRAAILDSRTVQSTPESGGRAGYDGHKRRKGSKVHLAVDTLGQLLAVLVTPADQQDRAQVAALAEQIQQATGQSVEVAFVDQGYTGDQPAASPLGRGTQLRLDGTLPPTGSRLRTLVRDLGCTAFCSLCHTVGAPLRDLHGPKFITGSRTTCPLMPSTHPPVVGLGPVVPPLPARKGERAMRHIARLPLALGTVSLLGLVLALAVGAQTPFCVEGDTINVPDDYRSIQAAIDAAGEGDTILVATGTYMENLSITQGISLSGGWDAGFVTRNPGATTVDGQGLGRVISITCATSDTVVTIDGFTVQNGNASGLGVPEMPQLPATVDLAFGTEIPSTSRAADPGSPAWQATRLRADLADAAARGKYPGGLPTYQAMLDQLARRTAQAERARTNSSPTAPQKQVEQGMGVGGGIYSYSASLHLLDCYIHSNVANQNGVGLGGGIYVGKAPMSGVQIVDNHIDSNVASNYGEGLGGGLYLFEAPGAVFTRNWFDHNVASAFGKGQGGGLFVHGSPGTRITHDEFGGNAASEHGVGLGGGLYVYQARGAIVEDSIFYENIASNAGEMIDGAGGGLMVDASPDAVLCRNHVDYNTASGSWLYSTGLGGGLFLTGSDGAQVSDNAFRGNLAALRGMGEGGGLTLYQTRNTGVAGNEVTGNWAVMYQAAMFGGGGGVAMESVYGTTLSGNDIRGNTAVVFEEGMASGGGVVGSGLSGQTRMVGNLISGNVACHTGHCMGGGVGIDGAQVVVLTDNTVADNVASLQLGQYGAGGGMYVADTVSSQVLGNRFEGNRAGDTVDSSGGGLMMVNSETSLGLATVDANLFLDNQPGGYDVFGMGHLWFTNNVVANNKTSVTGGLGVDLVRDGTVANNTIVDNGHHGVTTGGSNTVVTLVNNIVVSHTVGLVVGEEARATVRYTLWRGNDRNIESEGVVSHTCPVFGDPAFADAAKHDYHLSLTSAARDAGDPAGSPPAPDHDLDGVTRPQGAAVDVGAYEWVGYCCYLPVVVKGSP